MHMQQCPAVHQAHHYDVQECSTYAMQQPLGQFCQHLCVFIEQCRLGARRTTTIQKRVGRMYRVLLFFIWHHVGTILSGSTQQSSFGHKKVGHNGQAVRCNAYDMGDILRAWA